MTLNPFIELAQNPVGVLSALGYLLLLFGILAFGVPHAVRILIEDVYLDWRQNKDREKWARLWGTGPGYIPPFGVGLRAMWAFTVLFIALEASAALLWFIGVSGV
jgi:hypothetical protein